MSRIRLTLSHREKIAKQMVDKALADRRLSLNRSKSQLGDKVYNDLYTPELVAAMQEMPAGFFHETTGVKVVFEGLTRNGYQYVYWQGLRRLAFDHQQHVSKVYPASHPFNAMARKLDDEETDIKATAASLTQDALALMKSCATLAALLKKWPESSAFAQFVKPPEQLPMVPVDDLNRRLGLTPEKQA